MKLSGSAIIVATQNKGKVKEFAHAFAKLGMDVKSMYDFEHLPDIVEDGATFFDNALIKAKAVGDRLGVPVLADDSGLCVDVLDGAPGVYSARYAGEGAGDAANNVKLLQELKDKLAGQEIQFDSTLVLPTDLTALSSARFVCSLVIYDPSKGTVYHTDGTAEGYIIDRVLGEGGFGYDPLFWVPQFGRTMGQLTTEEKQSISHRGHALAKLMKELAPDH
ncbi:non-canonical purine NTP pyrophosphatase [Paenibacillus sp. GCM10012307]|uniref:dITP/XTP pyrophosphatase n=1 Tax=Paenibacillus roseus TaxID=2798579 RepID=A0A934J5E1_9BACL|nr:non-canonical purine NTP pyrophosphatase [Paenibacillus roseus]MBJ6362014.1 non-canonical purine NTP pyrophosphatase [Paenibacillus roseus]